MTLEEASRAALSAAESGDLDALASALDARARAIEAGELPTPRIVETGARTLASLKSWLRQAGHDLSRLRRLAAGYGAGKTQARHVDCQG